MKWNDAKKVLPALIDGIFSNNVLIRLKSNRGAICHYVAALKLDDSIEKGWSELEDYEHPLYFLIHLSEIDDDCFDNFQNTKLRIKLEDVTHWAYIEDPEGIEVS